MAELAQTLVTIVATQIIVGLVTENLLPYLHERFKSKELVSARVENVIQF